MISGQQIVGTFKSLEINGLSQEFTCNFIQSNSSFIVEVNLNEVNEVNLNKLKNTFNYTNIIIGVSCAAGVALVVCTIIYSRRKKTIDKNDLSSTSYSYSNPLMV